MAYVFQRLQVPPEEDLVLTGEGDYVWVDVDLTFRDEESGLEPVVRLRMPVPYSEGRSIDQLHGEAVQAAEELARQATAHLEENDVNSLVRMAMGT